MGLTINNYTMKIRDIITENIFTTDYHKVMDAVAKLYNEHYNVNIWDNAEAHDDAAKVLLKVHPTLEELEYIIKTAELPERFVDLDFPINDDIMYGVDRGGNEDRDLGEAQWDAAIPGRYTAHGRASDTDTPRSARARLPDPRAIDDPESDQDWTRISPEFVTPDSTDRLIQSQQFQDWLDDNQQMFTDEEWDILMGRIEDKYLEEIAEEMGITINRARKLMMSAVRKMTDDPGFVQAFKPTNEDQAVREAPASRALCTSGKSDSALGASQLASCKSQGYRSRDGGKSHKVGGERVKVRGKKIKGKKYGGPLPDWS